MVIIDSENGSVLAAEIFDTYKSSDEFDEFIMDDIKVGHIVVAACSDDCFKSLSEEGIAWFTDMGSKEILKLRYQQSFAFIGIYGVEEDCNETRATLKKEATVT